MDDHVFCWDGPAQLIDDQAAEIFRRAELRVDGAAEQLERASADLSLLVSFPITRDRVTNWLDERPADRRAVFDHTLWATIRWDKSLGRPSSHRLADAFSFHHWYLWLITIATEEAPIVRKQWIELPEPLAWDGPHDDQNYRVSVLVPAIPGLLNRFWPEMRRDIQWEPKFPSWSSTRRRLRWPEVMIPYGDFLLKTNDILVLEEEYQVIKQL